MLKGLQISEMGWILGGSAGLELLCWKTIKS